MSRQYAHSNIEMRGPSNKIWGRIPTGKWALSEGGILVHDDFTDHVNQTGITTAAELGRYQAFSKTGMGFVSKATVTPQSSSVAVYDAWDHGVWQIDGGDADEDDCYLQGSKFIWFDADAKKRIAFEARFKLQTVANTNAAMFVGLSNCNLTGTGLTDTTGALQTDADFIGFRTLVDDGDALDFVYQANGQTLQEVITAAHTLVADTWVKVGFILDPDSAVPPSERIRIFVDNVEQTTYVTDTNIAAATFPEEVALGLTYAQINTKGNSTAEVDGYLDWWRAGQGIEDG